MNPELTCLERDVMDALFAVDNNKTLQILAQQTEKATVGKRDFTGAGFFTHFDVSPDCPLLVGMPSFTFGDVQAEIDGIAHGAGFLLFVRNGKIDCLEGYTYDEPWPEHIGRYSLSYTHGDKRDIDEVPE